MPHSNKIDTPLLLAQSHLQGAAQPPQNRRLRNGVTKIFLLTCSKEYGNVIPIYIYMYICIYSFLYSLLQPVS